MAWIESHQSLADHRKLLLLWDYLEEIHRNSSGTPPEIHRKSKGNPKEFHRNSGGQQCTLDAAKLVGHLHFLWWWALDNVTERGSLGSLSNLAIARAARWDGDPDALVFGLLKAGFLDENQDGTRALHDWYDYAGKLLQRRSADRVRKSKLPCAEIPSEIQGNSAGNPPEFQRNATGIPYATVPYRTVPDLEGKKKEEAPPKSPSKSAAQDAARDAPEGAAAAPVLTPEWGQLRDFVAANRPRWSLTPATAQKISDAAHESSPELVLAAVQEAVDHNADTWEYAARILGRWRDAGITTIEDAWLEMAEFKRQRDERHYGPRQPPPEKPIRNSPEFEALLDGPDTPFRRD